MNYLKYITNSVPNFIHSAAVYKNEITLTTDLASLIPLTTFLKHHSFCKFNQLIDICPIDYPNNPDRFQIAYLLLSINFNNRITIKTTANESSHVPSLTPLFSSANWFEREAYDMFGIYFSNHPDLRRILTDYGFQGHPLRKDFPLSGYVEVRYDHEKKSIVQDPVELAQAFRVFDYQSPWEQTGPGVAPTLLDPKVDNKLPPNA